MIGDRLRLALFAFLAACVGAPPSKPSAAIIAPTNVNAPPITMEGDRPLENSIEPFEIAMDENHICVRDGGVVHCGKGEKPILSEPALAIADAISVSTHSSVTCVVTRKGSVHCKGANTHGELGARLRGDESKDLVRVVGIEDATRVFVGDGHVCALRANGTVMCWGRNESGQTGSDTAYRSEARELIVPTQVPALKDVVSIATGDAATCAATSRHETWCWGAAVTPAQERANGRSNEQLFRQESFAGLRQLSAGGRGMCGTNDNETICWGDTWGQSKEASKVAVKGVRRVRSGRSHSCALTHDGAVFCWGTNNAGELGRAVDNDDKSWEPLPPGPVANLPHVIDLALGGAMSCAITGRAEAMCWGTWPYTEHGQRKEFTPVKLSLR